MMRKIAIGLAAVTIATASSTLTASALPGGGTLGVANSGDDGFPQSASAGAALAEAALASIAVSDVSLASVVALPSIVALASTVDSDPAPSPSIAVSDQALASTVDSVAGLASVDLVVDGRSTPTRPPLDRPQRCGYPLAARRALA